MDAPLYNQEGKEKGTVTLPESIFGVPFNADLVHQVVIAIQANARTPVAHTKDRGDVRGGGRKPWRQKGTGRARVGSIRSPLWRGGGVTFGPRKDKDYSKKINKKVKVKALYIALSQKMRDGEILFIDKFVFTEPKTTKAKEVLSSFSNIQGFEKILSKRKNSALILLGEKDMAISKSFSNFGNIKIDYIQNLNAGSAFLYKHLVILKPETAIEFLQNKLSPRKEARTEGQLDIKKNSKLVPEGKIEKKPTKKMVKAVAKLPTKPVSKRIVAKKTIKDDK